MQYVGIQTQQSRNNRRSVFLLFLFPCLVAALLYLACYLLVALGHDESMETGMLEMINPLFSKCPPYTMGIVLICSCCFLVNTSLSKLPQVKAARPQGEQTCLQSGREPLHGERNEGS